MLLYVSIRDSHYEAAPLCFFQSSLMRLPCGNPPPCYAYIKMREQCSLILHEQSQARGFPFNEERHLNIQATIGQNMMEGEKERRKKIFSQSKAH